MTDELSNKRVRKSTKRDEFDYHRVDLPETSHEYRLSPTQFEINEDIQTHTEFLAKTFKMADEEGAGTTKPVSLVIKSLPEKTSNWTSYQDEIFKLFKVRSCIFDAETVLWPANDNGINLNNWFEKVTSHVPSKDYRDIYFDFLDVVLEQLDIDEISWYENAKSPGKSTKKELEKNTEMMYAVILKALREFSITEEMEDNIITKDIQLMTDKITCWLGHLRTLLEDEMPNVHETFYEESFRTFTEIVDLHCIRGIYFDTLRFHYEDRNGVIVAGVSSEPDLFVCVKKDFAKVRPVAVVEVKKPLLKGNKNEPFSPPILSKMPSRDEAASAPSTSRETTDDHPCALLKSDYPNGNPRLLTDAEKKACSVFLPQLFGEVLAVLNCSKIHLCGVPLPSTKTDHVAVQSYLGFGVVGLQVYVINFLPVKRGTTLKRPWSMHNIPRMKGMGTDILVSEPMHLLKRSDRNKLFRILAAVKHIL